LVSGYFELENLGSFNVKGVREPVGVHQLRDVGRLHTRLDIARARGLSKFVGRVTEMAALEAALTRANEGQGQVVGVVAEAGSGKSRLCFEFAERSRSRGIVVRETHGVAHGKMIPFLPVLQLLRDYFGIAERDSDEMARDKIAGRVVRLDPGLADRLPLLLDFLGVPDPAQPAPSMDPEAREQQIFALVRRLMHARSEREPAVFIIEDLHWIDGASEAFVENLVDSVPGTRTLLVVNFRPEYRADWTQKSYYQRLPLLPLGPEEIGELLDDLLGADPSLTDLSHRIRARTAGNPFFIEELVQSLVELETLVGKRGTYRLTQRLDEIAIPATVQAVLSARIDRLAERDKRVLQDAAVIGKTFPESILKRIVELPDLDLADALRTLMGVEFLYEETLYPEVKYAFKHPLTQEVALLSQLADRRRRVHRAVAEALEEIHCEKLDEQAALIAHHWEGAGEAPIAARWHRRAAVWAGTNHAAEAMRHWRTVRSLLQKVPETAEALALGVEARGQIMVFSSRLGGTDEEIDALFSEAKELAARSGDVRSVVLARIHYGFFKGLSGRTVEAQEAYKEAARLLGSTEDADLRTLIMYGLGSLRVALEGDCKKGLSGRMSSAIPSTRCASRGGDWLSGSWGDSRKPCGRSIGRLQSGAKASPSSPSLRTTPTRCLRICYATRPRRWHGLDRRSSSD
jgi:adenylate cyclase